MKYVELLKQKKAYVIGAIVLLAGGLLIAMKLFTQPVDNEQVFKDVSNSSSSGQSTVKNARATSKKEQKNTRITVDIFGAVAHEGVYQIAAGARLNDLIKLAGGIDVKADLKAINRALILTDEPKFMCRIREKTLQPSVLVKILLGTQAPEKVRPLQRRLTLTRQRSRSCRN
ncbi:SLBB domain-containing protein [Amylolactobacillus amylophilus]|uniref:SLBB domain-containing protein n=1 Tax=Amylolactobacillus amylophilus TaxID=1603 RepID=UPI0006D0343C|nr:SLBB domain-containing protein [Amylolactobacillus amylophilus]